MSQAIGKTGLAYSRVWHLVDARDRILGRMSTGIAVTLMGKHKPIFDPASDCGDYVVVINAKEVKVTGRKAEQKVYRYHTGYPGGLKEIPYARMMERNPTDIIRRAVSGMLPKNKLRETRLSRLLIFPEDKHPYEGNLIKYYDDPWQKNLASASNTEGNSNKNSDSNTTKAQGQIQQIASVEKKSDKDVRKASKQKKEKSS
ncbi:hypothetical protein G9A89_003930 [Geosiphon pyriformis]|nr:hypothetical protein G9A89_003930 [Geosiphon pyriformis]